MTTILICYYNAKSAAASREQINEIKYQYEADSRACIAYEQVYEDILSKCSNSFTIDVTNYTNRILYSAKNLLGVDGRCVIYQSIRSRALSGILCHSFIKAGDTGLSRSLLQSLFPVMRIQNITEQENKISLNEVVKSF